MPRRRGGSKPELDALIERGAKHDAVRQDGLQEHVGEDGRAGFEHFAVDDDARAVAGAAGGDGQRAHLGLEPGREAGCGRLGRFCGGKFGGVGGRPGGEGPGGGRKRCPWERGWGLGWESPPDDQGQGGGRTGRDHGEGKAAVFSGWASGAYWHGGSRGVDRRDDGLRTGHRGRFFPPVSGEGGGDLAHAEDRRKKTPLGKADRRAGRPVIRTANWPRRRGR